MKLKISSGKYKGIVVLSNSGYCNQNGCYYNVNLLDEDGKEVALTLPASDVEFLTK